MYGEARELLPVHLALASMKAASNLDAEPAGYLTYGLGAADRARGPVEADEGSVAGRVELAPIVTGDLAPDRGLEPPEEFAPSRVPQRCSPLGGGDHVHEEDRGKDAFVPPSLRQAETNRSVSFMVVSCQRSSQVKTPTIPGTSTSSAPGILLAKYPAGPS